MSTQALEKKKEDKIMEFVPFGAQDKIRLTVSIIQNMIAVKTRTGKNCSENDAIKFMMMCQARRLNPFEGDAFLVGYDNKDGTATFSLITAHQAFLKRAELNEEYDGMESGIVIEVEGQPYDRAGDFKVPGEKLLGGWAKVHFKNRSHPMYKRLALAQRRPNYLSQFWNNDKEAEQICKCAEADALRASFPTMLGGLYLKEELDGPQDPKIAAPIFKSAKGTIDITPKEAIPDTKTLEELRKKIKEAGVTEETLLGFMVEIGCAEASDKTLEDVSARSLNTVEMVLNQWDDFANRIKQSGQPS